MTPSAVGLQCFLRAWLSHLLGCGCLFVALLAPAARGDLVLTNFNAANPIRILPVGDSITDDCSISGAWRAPLQPLLEANSLPFTNLGRVISPAATGFAKRRHEGYCGSVVAAPGVFGPVNGYASPDNYLLRILPDALAGTNPQPDLVLVLIGANDLGRGRDPYRVATNDLAALVDLVFSATPGANILLAKTTTLQDAAAGYGAYATNVMIYNAALQSLVNQRRALGQNVFLADMFSAVDYATMFLSDHLHPNPLGLQAIAQEWWSRIQAISVSSHRFVAPLVQGGAVWNYSDLGQDLGTNWTRVDYDDSNWKRGPARLGYGDPAVATTVSYGTNVANKYLTTYFRHSFVVPTGVVVTNLNLRLARMDGAAVWLNGQEAFRVNLPDGPVAYTNRASRLTGTYASHVFYPTNLAVPGLPSGTNVVAVEVHLGFPSRTGMGFDLELIGMGYRLPPPTLSIAQAGGNVRLSWPLTNGVGFSLYSTTNLALSGAWTKVAEPPQTNADQAVVSQAPDAKARFYRLQQP